MSCNEKRSIKSIYWLIAYPRIIYALSIYTIFYRYILMKNIFSVFAFFFFQNSRNIKIFSFIKVFIYPIFKYCYIIIFYFFFKKSSFTLIFYLIIFIFELAFIKGTFTYNIINISRILIILWRVILSDLKICLVI